MRIIATVQVLLATAVLLMGPVSTGWTHSPLALHSQYARLSPELAKKLRKYDKLRTLGKIRGFEAASTMEGANRDQVLGQFGLGGSKSFNLEQIFIKKTKWPDGHRFRVCFFDGANDARRNVLNIFEAIIEDTNLKLDRTDRNCPDTKADIQIKFDEPNCFSYYGKDAIEVIKENKNNPTMGLCHLTGPTWTSREKGTIRHEIMHALGLAHEHQHPCSQCGKEINFEAFRNPPFFAPDRAANDRAIKVNLEEITKTYTPKQLETIEYDQQSIMHYSLPARFFKSPDATCILAKSNDVLSVADRSFLKRMYPKE